jgi:FecR-like protein
MYYLHHSATAFAAIVVGVIASTNAQAGSRVGGATSVVHDVASSVSGESWAKTVEGDDIHENEFIRTETESSARISFIDETDIRMGPLAKMKIDRVVFKSGRAVSELIVTAEAGAVRWNSGVSNSEAYLVRTPTVIIKVRGTTFDLFAEPQRTTVVLRRGTIEVCTIDTPQRCQTLSRPGDTVIGTPNVLDRPRRAGPGPAEFADRCLSSRAIAPCGMLASVQPTVQPTRSGSVEPPRPGSVPPTRSGSVTTGTVVPTSVPSNVPSSVPPNRGRGHVVYGPNYPSGDNAGPGKNKGPGSQTTPTPSKDCYRNRRGCQALPKPGRPDAKPPYVPKQPPQTKVTQKPNYSTQAVRQTNYSTQAVRQSYAQPRQTMQVRQMVQPRQIMMPMRMRAYTPR